MNYCELANNYAFSLLMALVVLPAFRDRKGAPPATDEARGVLFSRLLPEQLAGDLATKVCCCATVARHRYRATATIKQRN